MSNRIFLSVFCLMSVYSLSGVCQNARYKSILESESSVSLENYYAQLSAFREEYPAWPNVSYRLGEAEMKFFALNDPLVERNAAQQYLTNAKSYFSLARNYVDDKEARKNYEWYGVPDTNNKDSVALFVMNLVDKKLRTADTVASNYHALLLHYDKAVSFYLETRQLFIDINTRAENLRSLFLGVDDALRNQLGEMIQKFDSALFHIEKYRELDPDVPRSVTRSLTVTLDKIYHYRMNGLSPPNFLAENIRLWNYREWAMDFLELIEVEVDGLKHDLSDAFERFMQVNRKMLAQDECMQADVDQMKLQRLVNLVNKYDKNSRLLELFRYLMAKLQYDNELLYERNCNVVSGAATETLLSRKARIYKNIFSLYEIADSLGRRILLPDRSNASFQWFFDKYMQGGTGVQPFVEEQRKEGVTSFCEGLQDLIHLRDSGLIVSPGLDQILSRHGDTLSVRSEYPGIDTLFIRRLMVDSTKSVLLMKTGNAYRITGAKPRGAGYLIRWEKPLPGRPTFFKVLTDSSFVIGGGGGSTWLRHSTMGGTDILVTNLPRGDNLEDISYNDLMQTYRIVRTSSYDSVGRQGKYEMISMDGRGRVNNRQEFAITGRFLALVPNEDDVWVFTHDQAEGHSIINAFAMSPDSRQWARKWTITLHEEMTNPLLVRNDNQYLTLISRAPNDRGAMSYSLFDYNGNLTDDTSFEGQ